MSEVILYDALAIENKVKLEAARLNIQKLLDGISAIQWTEENINQDLLAPARTAVTQLKAFKDAGKRPHLDANTAYETAYKEVSSMIIAAAEAKANEKKALAQQIEREQAKIRAEVARIDNIRNFINQYITNAASNVLQCETDLQIIAIEKNMGSQLARKAFFEEFFDEFAEKLAPVKELIASRKAIIREKMKLERNTEADSEELAEKKEDLVIGLMQNQVEMHDIVDRNYSAGVQSYVGQSTAPVVVPARRQWKFEVTDLDLLHKKHPELITIEANEAAIRQLLSDYRGKGQLKDGIDINLPGLRFYQDKIYK